MMTTTVTNQATELEGKTKEGDLLAKEGYPILVISLILSGLLYFVHPGMVFVGLGWTAFCVYFFRNPQRIAPEDELALICPADGKVIFIGEAEEKDFIKGKSQRVTIFMSPFNVHVNRAPCEGTVLDHMHHHGKFLAAFDEKASDENERSAVFYKTKTGDEIVFVQIAGWFARRIISYPRTGNLLKAGQIFGVIRFGSRMDVYFPAHYDIQVNDGDKVKAGETILARRNK